MKKFVDIFQQRGCDYDRAMRRFPHARDMEFAQLVEAARLQPGDVVADCHRVVKPGGRLVVSDVLEHSRPAHFLERCLWVAETRITDSGN